MKRRFSLLAMLLTLLFISVSVLNAQDDEPDFPVTIEHKFGSITLTEAPERIVVLGFTEQDPYFALGVAPVAIRYWYGPENDAIFPWAEEEAENADPIILNMPFGTLNYEAILALEPDLISAVDAGITEEEYETLSQIAPTLAQFDTYVDFGMPWQETTRLIGTALGKSDEAESRVNDLETQLEAVRDENPEFDGKSIVVAYNTVGTYGYYTGQDSRGRFFTDLGFIVPDELNEIAGDSFYADISTERVDLLDRDLIVFLALQFAENGSEAAREAIEADPLLAQLDVVQDGRVLFVNDEFDNALQFSTILSIEFLLNNLVPEIAATLNGDEVVQADTCEDGFRLFDHEYLATDPVCIPENPQTVVPLDIISFEFMFVNGIRPAVSGALALQFFATTQPDLLPEFAALTEGLPDVGFPANPEVALSVSPDLIIGAAGYYDENVYDEMSQIAPMLIFDAPIGEVGQNWQPNYDFVATAFGMEDAVEQLIADYEARIAALDEALGDTLNGQTISVVRAVPPDQLGLRLAGSFSGILLNDLGIDQPESQQPFFDETTGFIQVNIGRESWRDIDGDYLFVYGIQPTPEGTTEAVALLESLADDPIWNALDAVQNDRVFPVGGHWHGFGVLAAHDIIDDLFTIVAGVEPAIPNPFVPAVEAPETEATEEASN